MKLTRMIICCVAAIWLAGAASLAGATDKIPTTHPEELPRGNPVCSRCHETASDGFLFKRFDHTPYFMENHRQEGYQSSDICSMCHQQSFCNDCHATWVELKPSLKNQSDTFRRTPHRGDYLARHRIDGRIDPTSCIRCHGNPKSAERCLRCHG